MIENEYRLPIRIFHDFTGRIEGLGIKYMLTGSMAMFHYAVYRMTADVDIVVELEPRHAQMLIDSLEPTYYSAQLNEARNRVRADVQRPPY